MHPIWRSASSLKILSFQINVGLSATRDLDYSIRPVWSHFICISLSAVSSCFSKKGLICLSCVGQRLNTILPQSSRSVLWTTKPHLTFHSDWIFIFGQTYPSRGRLWAITFPVQIPSGFLMRVLTFSYSSISCHRPTLSHKGVKWWTIGVTHSDFGKFPPECRSDFI